MTTETSSSAAIAPPSISGNGPETLVLGHGLLFDRTLFEPLIGRLQRDYRCVTFDFRGHGQSPASQAGYAMETLAEDVAGLIEREGLTPCHYLGFSMGGFVGLRLALKYPSLLKSLILAGTSADIEPDHKKREYRFLLTISSLGSWGNRLATWLLLPKMLGRTFMREQPEAVAMLKARLLANPRETGRHAVEAVLSRESLLNRLGQIALPTLCIAGEKDEVRPIDDLEAIRSGISGARLTVISGAFHLSPFTHPDAVAEAIRTFLGNAKP